MKRDSSDLDEARRQLRHLPQVLKCDHFLEIRLKPTAENAIDRYIHKLVIIIFLLTIYQLKALFSHSKKNQISA